MQASRMLARAEHAATQAAATCLNGSPGLFCRGMRAGRGAWDMARAAIVSSRLLSSRIGVGCKVCCLSSPILTHTQKEDNG